MPEVSRFFGVSIRMYFDDHNPPHFHAIYGDAEAELGIEPIALLGGRFPRRALGMVMEWAAEHHRVLLTHDVSTVTSYAYARVREGLSMPGVFEVSRKVSLAVAIEEIILLAVCSAAGEWEGQVRYLPLR